MTVKELYEFAKEHGMEDCKIIISNNKDFEVGYDIQPTNEQWFCTLSTEEKAKFLRKIYRDGRDDYVGEWYEQTEADFVEWLKEVHNADRS